MKYPRLQYTKSLLLAAVALAPFTFAAQAAAADYVLWDAENFTDTDFYKANPAGLELTRDFTPGITSTWYFPNNATRQFVTLPNNSRVLRFSGAYNGGGIQFSETAKQGTVTVDFSLSVSTNTSSFDMQLLAPGGSMTDTSLFGPQVRWQRIGDDIANGTVSVTFYNGTDSEFQVITGAGGLNVDEVYDYRIVTHLSGTSVGTFDFWLNGTEVATGLAFRSDITGSGINGVGFRYLRTEPADLYNITVTASQIPEAGHISLVVGVAAIAWVVSRRRRS